LRKLILPANTWSVKWRSLNLYTCYDYSTEVLNAAGILDEVKGSFIPDSSEMLEGVKQRALSAANDFRTTVRKQLNPEKIKELYASDPMSTMGLATGAFVGFLL